MLISSRQKARHIYMVCGLIDKSVFGGELRVI